MRPFSGSDRALKRLGGTSAAFPTELDAFESVARACVRQEPVALWLVAVAGLADLSHAAALHRARSVLAAGQEELRELIGLEAQVALDNLLGTMWLNHRQLPANDEMLAAWPAVGALRLPAREARALRIAVIRRRAFGAGGRRRS